MRLLPCWHQRLIRIDDFITESSCWLEPSSAVFNAGFLVPLMFVLLWNFGVFINVIKVIRNSSSEDPTLTLKASLSFFTLLGLSWLMAIPIFFHDWIGWQVMFVIGLATHGVRELHTMCSQKLIETNSLDYCTSTA